MLNINGKPDPSYRYKMTPISASINGKGNGVYTTILNLNEVCKDINQPPIVILKFLSLNFGSMCNEEKGTITGGYKNEEIQKALQVYINRFLICPGCNIPETIPQSNKENKKSTKLELRCSSCGKTSEVICNNKLEQRIYDLIIKYLDSNEWIQASKGTMVKQKVTEEDEFNPLF